MTLTSRERNDLYHNLEGTLMYVFEMLPLPTKYDDDSDMTQDERLKIYDAWNQVTKLQDTVMELQGLTDDEPNLDLLGMYENTGAIYGCECGCGGDFLASLDEDGV
jgi:hypothetical protein